MFVYCLIFSKRKNVLNKCQSLFFCIKPSLDKLNQTQNVVVLYYI